jgi:hypothetical protein
MTVRRSARCRCRARLAVNGDSAQTAPVRLRTWLEIAVFAVLCLALRASRYRADLDDGYRLLQQPPPPGPLHAGDYPPRPGQRIPGPARPGPVT